MSPVKQASKQKRTTKAAAVKVLGAAGLSFSLAGNTSASTLPTAGIPQSDNSWSNQRFVLSEEEMSDVSLATFYVFDRENIGSGVRLARGGCGGGHGGGGCGGCGHGGGGFGGCGHGGGGFVGGRGCGGGAFVGARGCGGRAFVGARGCGGFRGCRGFRGCGCGGCGFGFGFDDDIGGWGDGDLGYGDLGYGGCCASWGACRWC